MALLGSLTSQVSRGIPVGPHGANLLAEASLIPLDNNFISHGIDYVRFVDDIVVFCNGEKEATKCLIIIADILDKQQRLILNKSKTLLLRQNKFQKLCFERIKDRPISDLEEQLLDIIKKYSSGNPYAVVLLRAVAPDDFAKFQDDVIETILQDYLDTKPVDFIRFRWFLRKLTQIGHPVAIRYFLNQLDILTPALADVCHYLLAASQNLNGDISNIGRVLIIALDNKLIKANECFSICILSLISRNPAYNHFPKLVEKFDTASSNIKRKSYLQRFAQITATGFVN